MWSLDVLVGLCYNVEMEDIVLTLRYHFVSVLMGGLEGHVRILYMLLLYLVSFTVMYPSVFLRTHEWLRRVCESII